MKRINESGYERESSRPGEWTRTSVKKMDEEEGEKSESEERI